MTIDYNPKDIVIGQARVCWGFGCGNLIEGWVLPGGVRTMSRDIAESVCSDMNIIMGG